MTPTEKWANTKNANDSKTKKAIKAITRGGQFMLNNPGYIVGTQLGVIATGVGSAYADYKLSKPKPKGLTPPTKKSVNKVLKRSTSRYARSAPPVSKQYGDRYFRGFYTSSPEYQMETRLYGSKRANLTKSQQIDKQFANYAKTKIKDNIKASVVKTMGNVKKLTPAGLVGAIMQPKKVGDATLHGNQGKYKKVK